MNNANPNSQDRRTKYSFANFTLDRVAGTLHRDDEKIGLRSKSFEVLAYLVEHHGRLVEREELMQAVWPDVEVTDESVTRCIADIRKALADDEQSIIRTVPRRGYVLAASVSISVTEFRQPSNSQPFLRPVAAAILSPAVPVFQRRRMLFGGTATALILLGTYYIWHTWPAPGHAESLRAIPIFALPGVARYPSFSPDGDRIAFSWTGPKQDNPDIYVQQIGVGSRVRLTTDPGNDYNPTWSPDGRWIAFLRRHPDDSSKSDVRLVPPLGGAERKLTEIRVPDNYFVVPPYLAWCPDGTCLVATDSPRDGQTAPLSLISFDTGEKNPLHYSQDLGTVDSNPAISPDGRWLVFRRQHSFSRLGELYRLPLSTGFAPTGDPQRLTTVSLDAGFPTWLPHGGEILFANEASEVKGSLWRLSVSGPRSSQPARVPFVGEDGLMPAVSRAQPGQNARLIYVRSFQDSNIWRVETHAPGAPALEAPVLAISSSRRDAVPQFSPDGRRVAFASDRSGVWEIWLSDPDGSNAVQLTSLGTAAGAPAWSPDGERIVFQGASNGQGEVYMVPSAGGRPRNLTNHPANDARPSFSANGKWIYFTSDRKGSRQVWRMPISGGDPVQLTNNGAFAAFESPDGAYVYYNQTMDTPSPVWRVPASGGTPTKVLDGVCLGSFAVIDRGIYYIARPSGTGGLLYIDRPSGETRLQYFDFATGNSTIVKRDLGNVSIGLTVSKDGRTILYSRIDSSLDELMLVENFR